MKLILLITLVMLIAILGFTSFAQDQFATDLSITSSCGSFGVVSENLSNNITTNGSCVIITANNIELNCGNFGIIGNGTGSAVNITGDNITFKDCKIINFTNGFIYENSTNDSILNITFFNVVETEFFSITEVTDIKYRIIFSDNLIHFRGNISINHSFFENTSMVFNSSNVSIFHNVSFKNTSFSFFNTSLIFFTNSSSSNSSLLSLNSNITIVDGGNIEAINFTTTFLKIQNNDQFVSFHIDITSIATNLSDIVKISTNNISIDPTQSSSFNTSAKLLFLQRNIVSPAATVSYGSGFVDCPSSVCQNLTSNGVNVTYDVTQSGDYSIAEFVPPVSVEEIRPGGAVAKRKRAEIREKELVFPYSPIIIEIDEGNIESVYIALLNTKKITQNFSIIIEGIPFISPKTIKSLFGSEEKKTFEFIVAPPLGTKEGEYNGKLVLISEKERKEIHIIVYVKEKINEDEESKEYSKPILLEEKKEVKKREELKNQNNLLIVTLILFIIAILILLKIIRSRSKSN